MRFHFPFLSISLRIDHYHSDVTSELSLATFTVYDRSVQEHGFLGTVQIKPVLTHDHTVDQWYKYVLGYLSISSSTCSVPPYQIPDFEHARVKSSAAKCVYR